MKRKLEKSIKDNLLGSSLWINELANDCENQKAFLAIRDDKVGIYHKGGLLFCFDKKGFKTHIKYAAALDPNRKKYLTEDELTNLRMTPNFERNYDRIKENCSKYSGVEASGVSAIYERSPYFSNIDIVVLDIEVSFESFSEESNQDRIDLLLFNTKTKELKFVEAKHYSNKDIWSTKTPKVIQQITRYENQINQRYSHILSEYEEYIKTLFEIFGINLPYPTKIDPKVTLLIFGYDSDQSKGRLKKLIRDNPEYKGINLYTKGDISSLSTETLWNAKSKK